MSYIIHLSEILLRFLWIDRYSTYSTYSFPISILSTLRPNPSFNPHLTQPPFKRSRRPQSYNRCYTIRPRLRVQYAPSSPFRYYNPPFIPKKMHAIETGLNSHVDRSFFFFFFFFYLVLRFEAFVPPRRSFLHPARSAELLFLPLLPSSFVLFGTVRSPIEFFRYSQLRYTPCVGDSETMRSSTHQRWRHKNRANRRSNIAENR